MHPSIRFASKLIFTPLIYRPSFASLSARPMSTTSNEETAIFGVGCFWGPEYFFRKYFPQEKGLKDVKVGYIGGSTENPTYRQVCSGSTGHAEGVKLIFDPSKVSYADLVEFFYRMHDASQVDRQGPDVGTQYRSAIFYENEQQHEIAKQVTKKVQDEHYTPKGATIATEITKAGTWWDAEDYHQKYLEKNPEGYHCPAHRLYW